jgi:8-oxo-dGTP pyrophosphatase MutT (NUDIX family)
VNYAGVIAKLEAAFQQPLPGQAAHARLAPRPRREWPPGFDRASIRDAAGLVLLFPKGDRAYLILTVRANTLERHRGQVSLPGGGVDAGETFEQAALREANEEIGLRPDGVRIIGALTPLEIPVSGFRLHPVVAAIDERPRLSAQDREVAEILEVPIDALIAPSSLTAPERIRDGGTLTTPAFAVAGHEIWGATAMVLSEFLALLGWA